MSTLGQEYAGHTIQIEPSAGGTCVIWRVSGRVAKRRARQELVRDLAPGLEQAEQSARRFVDERNARLKGATVNEQRRPVAQADSAPYDDDELPPCVGEAYRDTLQDIFRAAQPPHQDEE